MLTLVVVKMLTFFFFFFYEHLFKVDFTDLNSCLAATVYLIQIEISIFNSIICFAISEINTTPVVIFVQ